MADETGRGGADGYAVSPPDCGLRDWFAGMAMQPLIASIAAISGQCSDERIARWAYEIADDMLKARE